MIARMIARMVERMTDHFVDPRNRRESSRFYPKRCDSDPKRRRSVALPSVQTWAGRNSCVTDGWIHA